MQVLPISYTSLNNKKITNNKVSKTSINFQGSPKLLEAINLNSLKEDSTRKIYSKLQKYFNMIGNEGKVDNVLVEKGAGFISISKNAKLSDVYIMDNRHNVLMSATFDNDGQMISGDLFSKLHFERFGKNRRVITDGFKNYCPCSYDDTLWRNNDKRIELNSTYSDLGNLFLELARLHTSILK